MIKSEREARQFVEERCDQEALARLAVLVDHLRKENLQQNLVAGSTIETVWLRHIADSAQLLDHVPRETLLWLDLGSGAGFPGLIVAAMRPSWPVHLVESRTRRSEWLERAAGAMALENVQIHGARLQSIATFPADVVSARAFAPLSKLLALSARFSTADTCWVLPKGRSAAQEVAELPKRLRNMFHVKQSVTSLDSGIVVGSGKVELKA